MSKPQTLLQLSGRSYAPATLANATLLVIDAQEEYRSGAMALPNLAPALAEPHREKSAGDMALKSKIARVRAKHLGIFPKSRRPLRSQPESKHAGEDVGAGFSRDYSLIDADRG